LARWYLRIARFLPTLKLEYKPGSANVVADALSRAPAAVTSGSTEVLVVSEGTLVSEGSKTHNNLELVQEQLGEDSELVNLIKFLETKELPSDPTEAKVAGQEGLLCCRGSTVFQWHRFVRP